MAQREEQNGLVQNGLVQNGLVQNGLVHELIRHLAPSTGGADFDVDQALGAVSRAIEATNRELDLLVTWLAADEGSRMVREISRR